MSTAPSISYVLDFIEKCHDKQKRKYTNDKYTIHCMDVANIISGITDDINMIYSALLHDVIEDSETTESDIKKHFGSEISRIVWGLTNPNVKGKRSVRKYAAKCWLENGDYKIHSIKLADIIDNLSDLDKHDPVFAKMYFSEKKDQIQVLTNGDEKLYDRAMKIINDYYERN